jgi:hypothetical protein
MLQCGLTQAQFKIGSAQFPATAIKLDDKGYASFPGDPMQHNGNGCAEAFCETLKAFGKSFSNFKVEKRIQSFTFRHWKNGKMMITKRKIKIASVGDFSCSFNGLKSVCKCLFHFCR